MSSPSAFPQTYGAILIGVIISTFLSGINTSQVIYYFSQYPGDPRRLKITVFATWLFDVIQAGLLGHAVYYYFVLNFFNPTVLSDGVWSLYLDVVITGVVTLIVQTFFADRVRRFKPYGWLTAVLIVILALFTFSWAIAFTFFSFQHKAWGDIFNYKTVVIMHIVSAITSDVCITISQIYYLRRSNTRFIATETLINRLSIIIFNQGLLTCILACCELVVFLVAPDSFYYVTVHSLIAKSYAGSLFASLNARRSLNKINTKNLPPRAGSSLSVQPPSHYGGSPRDIITLQPIREFDSPSLSSDKSDKSDTPTYMIAPFPRVKPDDSQARHVLLGSSPV
ncbi:hypothetical protein SISSUDRAFT_402495 [Sistotremastrum suecicum HHB10207 ss-3]|uniref:DUF6534 domain-containing protein n=1 Tax=Sistotremastrum suecicum HHB10207 ss-3 TaxID=1314776 RepID=A0A166FSV6_9AGAM|nr:hypothetical protein SISSUDRAFT_402495 [Sistotremastrum suecicum HHB10207 ss-3]